MHQEIANVNWILKDCTVGLLHRVTFADEVLVLCMTSISSQLLCELNEIPKITIRSFENIGLRCPLSVLNVHFVLNVV